MTESKVPINFRHSAKSKHKEIMRRTLIKLIKFTKVCKPLKNVIYNFIFMYPNETKIFFRLAIPKGDLTILTGSQTGT